MIRSWGPLGQSIDSLEAFLVRLCWDDHVRAAQREMVGWADRDMLNDSARRGVKPMLRFWSREWWL